MLKSLLIAYFAHRVEEVIICSRRVSSGAWTRWSVALGTHAIHDYCDQLHEAVFGWRALGGPRNIRVIPGNVSIHNSYLQPV